MRDTCASFALFIFFPSFFRTCWIPFGVTGLRGQIPLCVLFRIMRLMWPRAELPEPTQLLLSKAGYTPNRSPVCCWATHSHAHLLETPINLRKHVVGLWRKPTHALGEQAISSQKDPNWDLNRGFLTARHHAAPIHFQCNFWLQNIVLCINKMLSHVKQKDWNENLHWVFEILPNF